MADTDPVRLSDKTDARATGKRTVLPTMHSRLRNPDERRDVALVKVAALTSSPKSLSYCHDRDDMPSLYVTQADSTAKPITLHAHIGFMPVDGHEPEIPVNNWWRRKMRAARLEKGWSQSELGAKVGGSQNMISLLEKPGGQGSSSKVLTICRALSIPPPFAMIEDDLEKRWIDAGKSLLKAEPNAFGALLMSAEGLLKNISDAATGHDQTQNAAPQTPSPSRR